MEIQEKEWKYTVVGNIIKERIDNDGNLRHGTVEFCAGAKVYLYSKYWKKEYKTISVIGFARFKKWRVVDLPYEYIENVRIQKVYKPKVLEIMNNWEFEQGWYYNTPEDKQLALNFIEYWNKNCKCS